MTPQEAILRRAIANGNIFTTHSQTFAYRKGKRFSACTTVDAKNQNSPIAKDVETISKSYSDRLMTGGKENKILPLFALTGTGYHSQKTLVCSAQLIFKAKVWEGLS